MERLVLAERASWRRRKGLFNLFDGAAGQFGAVSLCSVMGDGGGVMKLVGRFSWGIACGGMEILGFLGVDF